MLKVDGTCWMWYSGAGGASPAIGLASSTDEMEWARLPGGFVDLEDNIFVGDPHVIQDGDVFKMWYTNWSPNPKKGAILYAESDDGLHWTAFGDNPVLEAGSFRVLLPAVQK